MIKAESPIKKLFRLVREGKTSECVICNRSFYEVSVQEF